MRKQKIALCGELAWGEAMDLLQDRLRDRQRTFLSKHFFINPTDAHNYKITGMLKQLKFPHVIDVCNQILQCYTTDQRKSKIILQPLKPIDNKVWQTKQLCKPPEHFECVRKRQNNSGSIIPQQLTFCSRKLQATVGTHNE